MSLKQSRTNAAIDAVIPTLRQSLAHADLWMELFWNPDENLLYVGKDGHFRIFWHDPTDRYCCQREVQDHWQTLVIEGNQEQFAAKTAIAIAAVNSGASEDQIALLLTTELQQRYSESVRDAISQQQTEFQPEDFYRR